MYCHVVLKPGFTPVRQGHESEAAEGTDLLNDRQTIDSLNLQLSSLSEQCPVKRQIDVLD